MSLVAQLFDDKRGSELAAAVRHRVQADPSAIFAIATVISKSWGEVPLPEVTRACTEEVAILANADPLLVRTGFEACLVGRDVDAALQWLHEIGAIQIILPELAATVDLAQEGGRRHKDVWEHTKAVVRQAVPRPVVRWAALLHDIGKVPTRTFTRSGVHFHGHAEVGARMFDKVQRRLDFPNEQRKAIRFLIRHHLRPGQYDESWTDSAVRRFARDMDSYLRDLLDLSRADITSKRPGRRRAMLYQISDLAKHIKRLQAEDAITPPLPPGLGNVIMEHFGLPPSRLIGELRKALEAEVDEGRLEGHRDAAYYMDWLRSSGLVAATTAVPTKSAG